VSGEKGGGEKGEGRRVSGRRVSGTILGGASLRIRMRCCSPEPKRLDDVGQNNSYNAPSVPPFPPRFPENPHKLPQVVRSALRVGASI